MTKLEIRGKLISNDNYHVGIFKDNREVINPRRSNTYYQLIDWNCSPGITNTFKIRGIQPGIKFINDRGDIKCVNGWIYSTGNEAVIEPSYQYNGKYHIISSNYVVVNDMSKEIRILDINDNPIVLDNFRFTIRPVEKCNPPFVIGVIILLICLMMHIYQEILPWM